MKQMSKDVMKDAAAKTGFVCSTTEYLRFREV